MNFPRARRWIETANNLSRVHGEADTQWNLENPNERMNMQAWVRKPPTFSFSSQMFLARL